MDLQKSILWRNNEEDNGGIKEKGVDKPLGILMGVISIIFVCDYDYYGINEVEYVRFPFPAAAYARRGAVWFDGGWHEERGISGTMLTAAYHLYRDPAVR
jgi:hypothetical protein